MQYDSIETQSYAFRLMNCQLLLAISILFCYQFLGFSFQMLEYFFTFMVEFNLQK